MGFFGGGAHLTRLDPPPFPYEDVQHGIHKKVLVKDRKLQNRVRRFWTRFEKFHKFCDFEHKAKIFFPDARALCLSRPILGPQAGWAGCTDLRTSKFFQAAKGQMPKKIRDFPGLRAFWQILDKIEERESADSMVLIWANFDAFGRSYGHFSAISRPPGRPWPGQTFKTKSDVFSLDSKNSKNFAILNTNEGKNTCFGCVRALPFATDFGTQAGRAGCTGLRT